MIGGTDKRDKRKKNNTSYQCQTEKLQQNLSNPKSSENDVNKKEKNICTKSKHKREAILDKVETKKNGRRGGGGGIVEANRHFHDRNDEP